MAIYTKTGDTGTTSLYAGKRTSKSDPRIEAYGSIDELSSLIGLTMAKLTQTKNRLLLGSIQKDLYQIMAYLSGAKLDLTPLKQKIKFFERNIDKIDLQLPKLTGFILPQGPEISGWFHVLRTVCRRAERQVVSLMKLPTFNFSPSLPAGRLLTFHLIIQYLNRLSDLFFTLARKYNRQKEVRV